MALTRRAFFAIGAALALSGCGSSKSKDDEEKAEEAAEEEAKDSEKKSSKKKKKKQEEEKQEEKAQEPEEPAPIVNETTYFDVFRADIQRGVLGDVESVTYNSQDFSEYYAILTAEGNFSFEIFGVTYNGKLTRGDADQCRYSGDDHYDCTRLLLDGSKYANVGNVDLEAFLADGYILVDMKTSVDGEYTDIMWYLWKHAE